MTKNEFFEEIRKELCFLPAECVENAVLRYGTYFTGGLDEDEVINNLGGAKGAARDYLSRVPHEKKPVSRSAFPLWTIVIASVILLPIAVPAAACVLAILLGLASLVFIILFAVTAGSVGLWIGGADVIIKAIPMQILIGDKIIQIGCGIMMFGLGIICMVLVFMLYRRILPKILKTLVHAGERLLKRGNI